MSEEGKAIYKLLSDRGQAGPDMTHALKLLGNNDMQEGLKRIAAYFAKEGELKGLKSGERSGLLKGATGAILIISAVSGIAYMVKQHKQNKEHKEEGERILQTLRQPVSDEIELESRNETKEEVDEKEV